MLCYPSWTRFNSILIAALTLIVSSEVRSATLIGSSDYSLFADTGDLPLTNSWINADNIDNVADMFVALDEGESIEVFGNNATITATPNEPQYGSQSFSFF